MDIAWFRDLVLIIEGSVAILALIFLVIVTWSINRRVKELESSFKHLSVSAQEAVDSIKVTAGNFASVSSYARSEIAEPLVRVATVIQGVSKGLDTVLGFFQRRK